MEEGRGGGVAGKCQSSKLMGCVYLIRLGHQVVVACGALPLFSFLGFFFNFFLF